MTGPTLFMLIFSKLSPVTDLNHLENQLLQLPPLMPTSSTAWPLVHHLLHVSIFAIKLQYTVTPKKATVETATYG